MKHRILLVGQDQPLWHEFEASAVESDSLWAFEYARSAPEALACLERERFAAAVTDVHLSDMNGLELLDEIMRRQPKALRFVLSDVADTLTTVKCVGRGHRHLMKPCDGSTLLNAINQSMAREKWLPSDALQNLLAEMRQVPSPPLLYFQIAAELQSQDSSVENVAELIGQDPPISAKVLQLANSALFGLQLEVTKPIEAISYIGLETTKALVLLAHTFSSFERLRINGFCVESLWRHSVLTGQRAKRIALLERNESNMADEAFTAGLLHDMGKLMFAANMPGLFTEALDVALDQQRSFWEVECQVLGACHAELGACLLGIWGLPQPLIEAVALHHSPDRSTQPSFNSLTAVHVANVFEHELHSDSLPMMPETLDLGYLKNLGLERRIDAWRTTTQAE
jgi:HD-like signal output (HDOD) protein